MMNKSNEIYSDQYESENENIELVRQLGENDKETINNLEELLKKSRQLNSSKSLRLIDEKLENIPRKKNQSIENLILSCNILGKNNEINWTLLPNHLKYLELSSNFLSSINGIDKQTNNLQSLGLSFNEIDQILSIPKWSNLCLIDLSYNILNDLEKTIQSLNKLDKLRILYLHGNPISLIVDYRLYIIDSLKKLSILDDITITDEEKFRARHFSNSNQHPKHYAQFTISFGSITNIPPPPINQNEWPIQVHHYKMRIDWFDGEKEDIDIPFDKMSNFNRFNKTHIESSNSDYKTIIDFSPNSLDFQIENLIPFRDFIFHGTTCRFIHQMSEYWPSTDPNETSDQKKKSNSSGDNKDKKNETPAKKKKNEDLSKLIQRKEAIENILAEFNVNLRSFLDGDYHVSHTHKSIIQQQQQQQIDLNIQTKPSKKKDNQLNDSPQDKKRTSSSKSNKDKQKDKKQQNDNQIETPLIPEPFQCSIQFQLHRFISEQQII